MLLLQIIIATTVVSLISLIGIVTFYRDKITNRSSMKMIISLAAGALLAFSFLDLLPESIAKMGNYKLTLAIVLISFVFFFILEKFWHWHHCQCHDGCDCVDEPKNKSLIYTNLIGDGLHNMIDGVLIASAFMLDFRTGILATIAVILHEIPHELTDFIILIFAGLKKSQALAYNLLFALTAILGGIISYYFGKTFIAWVPVITAFAAGNFIYLAASDLIPELHQEKNPKKIWQQTVWLMAGVLIIYGLMKFLPG